MITSDEAERIATEVIGPVTARDGQGWYLEGFDSGRFVREHWMGEKSVRCGSFCVVERAKVVPALLLLSAETAPSKERR
jgi:hypothetical protein